MTISNMKKGALYQLYAAEDGMLWISNEQMTRTHDDAVAKFISQFS